MIEPMSPANRTSVAESVQLYCSRVQHWLHAHGSSNVLTREETEAIVDHWLAGTRSDALATMIIVGREVPFVRPIGGV